MNGFDRTVLFDDLRVGETDIFSFNFTNILRPGKVISNPAVVASVLSGDDPAPQDIVQGAPGVDATQKIASVYVKGLVPNVTYCLAMSADTDDAPAASLTVVGRLEVTPPCG